MEEASQGRSQDSQIAATYTYVEDKTDVQLWTPDWEVDGPQKKKRRTQTEMENEFAKQQQQRDVLSNVPLNPTTTNGTVGCDRDSMERCVSNAITKSIPKIALGCIFFMNEWFGLANLAKTGTDNLKTAINDVVNEAISNNKEIYSPEGKLPKSMLNERGRRQMRKVEHMRATKM
ncbi:ribosomal protein L29 [Acrasis kona]|uniref:Ribosomal protein L29 n=1 Tax=Acrasis kona TaxID=1008807 RepID=A0AAW2ZTK9_9EUKA